MPRAVAARRTHLVVGDAHFNPSEPGLERADWLGRAIVDLRPDVVVILGDWWSLDSLSRFSPPGSLTMEGARLADDLDVGREALGRVRKQLDDANRNVRGKNKIAPEMHLTLGNHEERLLIQLEETPSRLMGFLDEGSFGAALYGFLQHSFLEDITIDGVAYCHYFAPLRRTRSTRRGASSPSNTDRSCLATLTDWRSRWSPPGRLGFRRSTPVATSSTERSTQKAQTSRFGGEGSVSSETSIRGLSTWRRSPCPE